MKHVVLSHNLLVMGLMLLRLQVSGLGEFNAVIVSVIVSVSNYHFYSISTPYSNSSTPPRDFAPKYAVYTASNSTPISTISGYIIRIS